jgi:hypothetical protein
MVVEPCLERLLAPTPLAQRTDLHLNEDVSGRARSFVSGPELVLARIASADDEIPAENLFGGEGVVGAAAEGDVVEAMFTALREGHRVM